MSRPQRTTYAACRGKAKYRSENAALGSLRDIYRSDPERNGEQRAYPCDKGEHWHLTSRPVLGNRQTLSHIALLERTIVFLLQRAADRDLWKREAEFWKAQNETLVGKLRRLAHAESGAKEPSPVERAEIRKHLEKIRQAGAPQMGATQE